AVPASGLSRAAALRAGGRIPDNESYAESLYGRLHFGYAPVFAVRAEGWKYVDLPRAELYRLSEDPGETTNLLDPRASVAAALRPRLAAIRGREAGAPAASTVDPDAAERLASLGYAGGPALPSSAVSGVDPKDRVREFTAYERGMREALAQFQRDDLAGAIALLRPLAASSTESFNVAYYLGRSLLGTGQAAEAVPPLETAAALAPRAARAWVYLARAYVAAGRPADARAALEKGLRAAPANAELHFALGRLLLQTGDLAGAHASLEKARALTPHDARVRADLSNVYRNAGRVAAALAEADEAVRLEPRGAVGYVARGLALAAGGDEKGGAAAL